MNEQQIHPQYLTDRDHIQRLMAKATPSSGDLVDLARLLTRYEDFPGASDLKLNMEKILKSWNITRFDLNTKTRKIWSSGYRPSSTSEDAFGSGFDTSDSETD